jgi:H+/Cl- antiporter ClcA
MVNSLLLATFIRTLLVIVSYGCKVPAGIFVPSMAIGATFGRMVGILVKALYKSVIFSRKRYQTKLLTLTGRTQLLVYSPYASLMFHV